LLHVLVGTSADYDTLIAGADRVEDWIVPKRAQSGDEVLVHVTPHGIVGFGVIDTPPFPATFRGRPGYRSAVSGIRLVPVPVPAPFLADALPRWGWPRYPRSYTSVPPEFASQIFALVDGYQDGFAPDRANFQEGGASIQQVTSFERNPRARAACLRYYGTSCFICGFDFAAEFGQEFEGFIHVHHVRPLATIRASYVVNAVKDLRPLCPNCHAAAHRRQPPFTLSELKVRRKHTQSNDQHGP
jgi:hypothetical protein